MNKDGGPAFPMIERGYNTDRDEFEYASYGGMTLRDYFAAKALPAVIGKLYGPVINEECPGDFLRYAGAAYALADAMLKARQA